MNQPAVPTTPIRLLLNGEAVTVEGIAPQVTLLQYLREYRNLTGTKEGCAEGDCGACAVVLASRKASAELEFRTVNSCIRLLPTIDGMAVFTVEVLSGTNGALHPVQQALVDTHGSQCGFCTPGFVMSLFALYKNTYRPARTSIEEAISGNLCRCTGYRPIISAAERMYDLPPAAGWRAPGIEANGSRCGIPEEAGISLTLKQMARTSSFSYAVAGQRYFAPTSLKELTRLCESIEHATLIAGATDVALRVTKEHRDLGPIIYVGAVPELATIVQGAGIVDIGAAVSITDAIAALDEDWPELHETWVRFASPPVRNSATLGGNVMNASPIGDSIPALLALGASLRLESVLGAREVALEAFYLGYRTTLRKQNEVLSTIRIPKRLPGTIIRGYKVSKRTDQDISSAYVCFRLDLSERKIIAARIGVGGLAAIPTRAYMTEAALVGSEWSEGTACSAAEILRNEFSPIADMRASAGYRREIVGALLQRFWLETRIEGAPTMTRVSSVRP